MENGGKARLRSNKKDDKREKGGVEEVMFVWMITYWLFTK